MSIHKLQVIFSCAESSRSSQTDWQSCGFLPFPYSQQGYMNFNSWWAAYNSSSLGANMTGEPGFPYEKQTGHLQKVSQWTSLSFLLLILYSVSFEDLSSSDLFLYKSKPWGDMKKTNIKKRKLNPEMKKLEVSNTPQCILPSRATVQPSVPLQVVDKYWQLEWVPPATPPPMVKAHQINTRQEEFSGRVRN